jgi:hypothetical protein
VKSQIDWAHRTRQRNYLKQEVLGRTNRLLSFDMTCAACKRTLPTILLLLRVSIAAGTYSRSRCLATMRTNAGTQTDRRAIRV